MFWEVYALDRQEYLKSLTEQIRTKRARTMVAEEVEAHIEDQKQDFMAHGLGEEEAESMAVVEMGDPVEAGVKLDRVHRPKMEWTVLMAILVISIMGLRNLECNVNRNCGHVRNLLSGLFYISKVVISNLGSHADTGSLFYS